MQSINNQLLSIIIPVFNEEVTIISVLDKVFGFDLYRDLQKEVIIINDGSVDKSNVLILKYIEENLNYNIKYHFNHKNQGKGASIKKGLSIAKGDFILIQDADLEYNIDDYNILLKPILDGASDIVYGSRFIGIQGYSNHHFWHGRANLFLNKLSNLFLTVNLTDMECCYKLFRKEHIDSINLRENRFGFEPEVTHKILRIPDIRICEVSIGFNPRQYNEGKKIGLLDGFRAIWCIIKYGMLKSDK